MSELESLAVVLGFANVALVVGRSIWNYPIGIVMVSLYFFIFLEHRLYSDALLQIFFFVIQLYGWWAWSRAPKADGGVAVERMSRAAGLRWFAATAVGVAAWGTLMHRYTDAAAPFVDAGVAGLSVAAQILQSLRRVESWIFWIAADVIAIGLYAWKGLSLTSVLYAVFLVMAAAGLFDWRRRLAA